MKIRLEGLALLALCALALHRIYQLDHMVPHHQPSSMEFALALVAVLAGMAGAAMLAVGPRLFRDDVWPPPESD